MTKSQDGTSRRPLDDGHDQAAVVGVAGAVGRDQYVGAQIGKAEVVARTRPSTAYDGELYRSVEKPEWAATFADHSKGGPGR